MPIADEGERDVSRLIFSSASLCFTLAVLCAQAQEPSAGRLSIKVVQGDNFINNVKRRTTRETIAQVEDENHRPVAGAVVTFILPGDGPGGSFANGARSLVRTTGADGRATMTFQPNQAAGQFNIRVTASFQGRQASSTITQTNATANSSLARPHRLAKTLSAVGGAGLTVGICRAAHCGGWGSDSNSIQINSVTIGHLRQF